MKSGEEEKSVTAVCTVVKVKITNFNADGNSIILPGAVFVYYVRCDVDGYAKPAGLGLIRVTITPSTSGRWWPNTRIYRFRPENFSRNNVIFISDLPDFRDTFTATATYAGISDTVTNVSY